MILQENIRKIAESQKEWIGSTGAGIPRELLNHINLKSSFITIITGIRRSGKSTLLKQLMNKYKRPAYFNFEDQRTFNFEINDFEKLDAVFQKQNPDAWFFDEIQNIEGWERYIRSAHDKNRKIFITGSNATLLSKELGTRLTGRHISHVLFPFSYHEFLLINEMKPGRESLADYMSAGGFPEYIRNKDIAILQQLFADVILRDITVRYDIRQEDLLQRLALFLISNTGKEYSYNKLHKRFRTGSVNTIISYISYLVNSYILSTVPVYSASISKQMANPKKIYSIDTGLINANTLSFSDDLGRILENVVYLELLRQYRHIFYHKNDNECDFIVQKDNGRIIALQVCYELNNDNLYRELEALKNFKFTSEPERMILTLDQEDSFDGIPVLPVWKWLTGINKKGKYTG